MGDERLAAIDGEIARLQQEREKRERKLADPKWREIHSLYVELDRVLNRLNELGENVATDDGHCITVMGTLFYYDGETIRER